MWEDILKLRQYELGDERRSSGRKCFEALEKIVKDLQIMCNKVGISFTQTHVDNSYSIRHNSDYYSMLERLNSVIYSMSMKPELDDLTRESQRTRDGKTYTRKALVNIRSGRMRIHFSTFSFGKRIYRVNMAFSAGAIKFNNKKLIVLKKRLKYYFMKNFDNGTLDVESLVDNIFNHLGLTVVEETEQEPEQEPEGTIREKWWE